MSSVEKIGVISIGDELLAGKTVNTNAAWLGGRIAEAGHVVSLCLTIPDDAIEIRSRIEEVTRIADHVVVTGGLGPTDDDLTREVVAEMLGVEIVNHAGQRELIEDRFARLGRTLNHRTIDQANVPQGVEVLLNHEGTAPGMVATINQTPVLLLPGVPYEMKGLFEQYLEQRIATNDQKIERNWLTGGIPESELAIRLESVDARCLKLEGCKLAYLPSSGVIRLRLVAFGSPSVIGDEFNEIAKEIERLAGPWIIGEEVDRIEALVARLLLRRGETLSTAESCTGGMLGERLTELSGSSDWYLGGVVSYANSVKAGLLGVSEETLQVDGAVSERTACEMAEGVLLATGSTYSLSTTGIAGPGGGSEEKPVGTVWIGSAWRDVSGGIGSSARLHRFRGARNSIRLRSVIAAQLMLVDRVGSLSSSTVTDMATGSEGPNGSPTSTIEKPTMNLIFFGAPGVGKGTQAAMLADKIGVPHISTGAIFRTAMEEGTPLGTEVKAYYDKGELVPDELTTAIVVEALGAPEQAGGFILDGYPRNRSQAEALNKALEERGKSIDRVVFLTAPDEEITRRMLGRGRADDTEEVIANRLAVYRSETAPVLEFYANAGIVSEIDGVGELETVHGRVLDGVNVETPSGS